MLVLWTCKIHELWGHGDFYLYFKGRPEGQAACDIQDPKSSSQEDMCMWSLSWNGDLEMLGIPGTQDNRPIKPQEMSWSCLKERAYALSVARPHGWNQKSHHDTMWPSRARHGAIEVNICFSSFGLSLIKAFLPLSPFCLFGMGTFTLPYCVLGVCKFWVLFLLFFVCLLFVQEFIVNVASEETLSLRRDIELHLVGFVAACFSILFMCL